MGTSFRLTVVFAAIGAWILCLPCLASEIDAGFSVNAVIPENQINPDAKYFDLQTHPGMEQDLVVQIHNPGEETMRVTVEAITASTNRDGFVHYSSPGVYDQTMPFSFSDLAKVAQPTMEVEPGGTQEAVISLSMPEQPYCGMLLGSIRILKEPDVQGDFVGGVVNQYSYVIAVRLYGEEPAQAGMDFGLGEVSLELVNHKAAVVAQIRNPQPAIAKGVTARTRVYPKDSATPVIEKTQTDVEIAPHSIFPMTLIDQEGYGFPEGVYTAAVTLQWEEQTWEFQQDFAVTSLLSQQINNNAVNQTQNQMDSVSKRPVGWYIACGLALAAAILLALYCRRRKLGALRR